MSNKIVDIYIPLDERESANNVVWPVAMEQLGYITKIIEKAGWTPNILNPKKPVSSVKEGLRVIKDAKGERFINFMAGWTYPDFTVSPMAQLPRELPKLMLGSTIPDFPGAVGVFAAASGLAHVGIETSRIFVEEFDKTETYEAQLTEFLNTGKYEFKYPKTIAVEVTEDDLKKAKKVKEQLRGMVYGAVGPRSMQMWNKISDADFLKIFGIAREGFDGLRLMKMAEKIPTERAEKALAFLEEKGMEFKWGKNPETHLTRDMVIFQMKVYFAVLELKDKYGLDFMGVQDQLDWVEHLPATDLTLGLLNNKLRPESNGETVVVSTEADDGAAITMQVLKLINNNEPAGFNDLRYWDSKKGLYWFVNSGSLAPYFAHGSHDSFEGSWSERQTPMYFKQGGGTCSTIVKKPGVVTWARFSYRDGQMYLCAGRGVTDVPSQDQWQERSAKCSPDWPHWYIRLCGPIEHKINTNHPMTAFGDHLGALKALAIQLDIPFECYDTTAPII